MMSDLPDFGTFHNGHEDRPGPIRTLVDSLKDKEPRLRIETVHHAGRTYALAEDVADLIDKAIAEAAASIRQLKEGEDRFDGSLRKVVVVTDLGNLRDLDEIVDFFQRVGGFSLSSMADDSWNLRNGMVPFKDGDELQIEDE